MNNCPNCGAILNPEKVKCEYCGTYFLDFIDITRDRKPFYLRIKTEEGIAISKVYCQTVEMRHSYLDYDFADGVTGRHAVCLNRQNYLDIEMEFMAIPDSKGNLMTIDTSVEEEDGN